MTSGLIRQFKMTYLHAIPAVADAFHAFLSHVTNVHHVLCSNIGELTPDVFRAAAAATSTNERAWVRGRRLSHQNQNLSKEDFATVTLSKPALKA